MKTTLLTLAIILSMGTAHATDNFTLTEVPIMGSKDGRKILILTDEATGCQYIYINKTDGYTAHPPLIPRLKNGNPLCERK